MEFLSVMVRARRQTSCVVTVGDMRTPPMAGPSAVLSITTTALTASLGE